MIQEIALLDVIEADVPRFLNAFEEAQHIISAMNGYRGHSLARCIEQPNRFLLSVYWNTVEDHEVGFRQSPAYERWRALLHHYYDPFPTVQHFEEPLLEHAPQPDASAGDGAA